MSDAVTRRQFVTTLAVFGTAMALPRGCKADELPPAQSVIVLPPQAKVAADLKSLIWIDRVPITSAYNYYLNFEQDLFRAFKVQGHTYPVSGAARLQFKLMDAPDDFPNMFKYMSGERAEILFRPTLTSESVYLITAQLTTMSDYANFEKSAALETEWLAIAEPKELSRQQMMEYLTGRK